MKCIVWCVARNVAPLFKKAIYKEIFVGRKFDSVKDACKAYNLAKCNYEICVPDSGEKSIRVYYNCNLLTKKYY